MSVLSRRKMFNLFAAALAVAALPTLAVAEPTVWVRFMEGNVREWFPVPMWNNTIDQTIANFSVGWSRDGGKPVKVETCVTYGDQKP